MKNRAHASARGGAALLASTLIFGAGLLFALPAAAIAPTSAAINFSGDDPGSVDACLNYPCQGASPGHPWGFSATTGGLNAGDVVSFTFTSTVNDRLHAVAMPLTIAPESVVINMTGSSMGCFSLVDSSTPTHPAAVTVDWANQSFGFAMPGPLTAGQTAEFCFTDSPAIGMPLTPGGGRSTSPYRVKYTEPGGNVSAAYNVLARRADPPAQGNEAAPPFMHFFDAANNEVSNAGEAGTAAGFFNTTYKIVLKGTPAQVVVLSALSGRHESFPTAVVDPRVTITCPAACTPDAGGVLNATFTVSAGATDHFVISADCTGDANGGSTTTCQPGDSGVTAFTAVSAPIVVASPTPSSSPTPALPAAGQHGPVAPTGRPWVVVAILGGLFIAATAALPLRRRA